MIVFYPPEVQSWLDTFMPFVVDGQLENPTSEARKAFEKFKAWSWEQDQ